MMNENIINLIINYFICTFLAIIILIGCFNTSYKIKSITKSKCQKYIWNCFVYNNYDYIYIYI